MGSTSHCSKLNDKNQLLTCMQELISMESKLLVPSMMRSARAVTVHEVKA